MIGNGLFHVGIKDAAKIRKPRARKEKPPKGSRSEHSLHYNVASLLDKHLAAPAWYTTFPAGGGGEMRGKILKGLGLKSGVPDILIIFPYTIPASAINGPNAEFAVVPLLYWIELKKTGKGKPSEIQIATQQQLTQMGCRVANCDSLEAVKAALREWGLPWQKITPTENNLRNSLQTALANV
jgi:hypothetical protein